MNLSCFLLLVPEHQLQAHAFDLQSALEVQLTAALRRVKQLM